MYGVRVLVCTRTPPPTRGIAEAQRTIPFREAKPQRGRTRQQKHNTPEHMAERAVPAPCADLHWLARRSSEQDAVRSTEYEHEDGGELSRIEHNRRQQLGERPAARGPGAVFVQASAFHGRGPSSGQVPSKQRRLRAPSLGWRLCALQALGPCRDQSTYLPSTPYLILHFPSCWGGALRPASMYTHESGAPLTPVHDQRLRPGSTRVVRADASMHVPGRGRGRGRGRSTTGGFKVHVLTRVALAIGWMGMDRACS